MKICNSKVSYLDFFKIFSRSDLSLEISNFMSGTFVEVFKDA